MMQRIKYSILIRTFLSMLITNKVDLTPNCLVLQSTNIFGAQRSTFDPTSCFDVEISDLKHIVVHSKLNVVGFTFVFLDGHSTNFIEISGSTNQFQIDLTRIDLIGANIFIGEGIEGLQFQLFNWSSNNAELSEMMGQSTGCFSYFNSSSLNIKYLQIKSFHGCVDNQNSNYFPFLSFSYSFSQCPLGSSLNHILSTVSTHISSTSTEKSSSTISSSTMSSTSTVTTTITNSSSTKSSSPSINTTIIITKTDSPITSMCPNSGSYVYTLTYDRTSSNSSCILQNQSYDFMFSNFVQKASLKNYGYNSMGMPSSFAFDGTYNYIIDYSTALVYIYDNYWQYQSYKTLPYSNPYHFIYVSGYFYIVDNQYAYKADTSFNVVGTPYNAGLCYRGVAYANNLIYAAHQSLLQVHVFNINSFTSYQYYLNTAPYSANGVNYYNGKVFVGCSAGVIMVFTTLTSGSTFSSSFQTACSTYIMSISADVYENLGISCLGGYAYAYTPSGNLQNTLPGLGQCSSISLDYMGRLIAVGYDGIYIYF